ncbi:MAG: cytochrome b/b6 domain-containing protein [Gammaproteobacteria bacterium]|jgi:cytochrome b
MERNTVKVWDPLVRIFHWSLVLGFTIAYVSGEEFPGLHIYSGYAVFGLLLLRLVWGVIGTRHARFSDFVYRPAVIAAFLRDTLLLRARRYLGHNPAGGAMILLMLVTLVLTAVSGIAVTGIESGSGPLAVLAGSSELLEEVVEELHEFMANLMVLLVVVHVAGVIAESVIHRESLVKAMVTGRKQA